MTDVVPFNERIAYLQPAAATLALPFAFPLDTVGDVRVRRFRYGRWATLGYPADYHFPDGLGDDDGGTVYLRMGSLAGDAYLVEGFEEPHRVSDYQVKGGVASGNVNADFNRLTRLTQEATRAGRLALKRVPGDDDAGGNYLPVPEAGRILLWDENGQLVNGPDADDIAKAQEYAERAEGVEAARALTYPETGPEIYDAGGRKIGGLEEATDPDQAVTLGQLAGLLAQIADLQQRVEDAEEVIAEGGGAPGDLKYTTRTTPPATWSKADGELISVSANPGCYAAWVTGDGNTAQNFTVSIANPAVFTKNGHGLKNGTRLRLFTSGSLPTVLATGIDYYVIPIDANTFHLAVDFEGTPLATSGGQSGTHKYFASRYGLGDATLGGGDALVVTQINKPDHRGLPLRALDAGKGIDLARGQGTRQGGAVAAHPHSLAMSAVSDHAHSTTMNLNSRRGLNSGGAQVSWSSGDSYDGNATGVFGTSNAGGHTPTGTVGNTLGGENRMPNAAELLIVKLG